MLDEGRDGIVFVELVECLSWSFALVVRLEGSFGFVVVGYIQ